MSQEYAELAQRHLQHDLTTSDRQVLESAAKKFGLYSTIGASVGLGLGLFLSLRIRRAGQVFYNAAKKAEKPTAIQFADGHTGEPNQVTALHSILIRPCLTVPFPDTTEFFRP